MNEISVWYLFLQVFPSLRLTGFPPRPPIAVGASSSIIRGFRDLECPKLHNPTVVFSSVNAVRAP